VKRAILQKGYFLRWLEMEIPRKAGEKNIEGKRGGGKLEAFPGSSLPRGKRKFFKRLEER